MSRQAALSLGKYYGIFVGAYFAVAFLFGLTFFVLPFAVVKVLSFLYVPTVAFITLRWFVADHDRGLDVFERGRMIRFGLLIVGGVTLFGLLAITALAEMKAPGLVPVGYIALVGVVGVAFSWLQLWLVYRVLNSWYPESSNIAGPTSGRPQITERVRVLVVGDGAAAHALAFKLGQSAHVLEVLVAPGNAGTSNEMRCRNVSIAADNHDDLVAVIRREAVHLTIAARSAPALVDKLRSQHLKVVGATTAAAALADLAFVAAFAQKHSLTLAGANDVGTDVDVAALADGRTAIVIATTQALAADGQADSPVTSPAPALPAAGVLWIARELLQPTMQGLMKDSAPYMGFLQARVRVADDGTPRLVGFTAGLDDLSAPAWILRLQSDLFELCEAAVEREVDAVPVRTNPRPSLAQPLRARDATSLGARVEGLSTRPPLGTHVFHGATRRDMADVVVAGGHVLTVSSLGDDVADARRRVNETAAELSWAARKPSVATT